MTLQNPGMSICNAEIIDITSQTVWYEKYVFYSVADSVYRLREFAEKTIIRVCME